MTKRLMAALLCAAATFALCGVATAQAQGLSYRTAKGLATRLAEKQVRGRSVVSFHLLKARRVSSTRIVFPYNDRTSSHVFCTALLIVDQRVSGGRTITSARFASQRCNGIPAEVLKFESITRRTQRALRGRTAATVAALARVKQSARRCRALRVPKTKVRNAQALFDIATVEALEGPNNAVLGAFSYALLTADVSNRTLHTAGVAWADYVATIRSLPAITDPCAALKRWAAAGFASSRTPIDFAAYRALDRRAAVDRKAITAAANLMARDGVFPNVVVGFTPDGLLLQLAAKSGITGGKGKLILG